MTTASQEIHDLLEKWSFHWGIMDVLIGGRSSIDLSNLMVENWQEATDFLHTYGFELNRKLDAKTLHSIIIESWSFIENQLMPIEWANGCRPPQDLLMADDPRIILLAAADGNPSHAHRQQWACCALKLMHTIAHIDGIQRLLDQGAAQQQIMERFHQHIFRDSDGCLMFGKNQREAIALSHIEWKYRKTRDSMILKLLHKPANVAETIYDMVGVRIVTKKISDVMVAVKLLHELNIVSFANCSPRRARNTLIDAKNFKLSLNSLLDLVKNGQISPEEFSLAIDKVIAQNAMSYEEPSNPHSSQEYRSIHLTCRQIVRYADPSRLWLDKLRRFQTTSNSDPHVSQVIQEILTLTGVESSDHKKDGCEALGFEPQELAGFFPYEVQLMDVESYHRNMTGDRKHSVYKMAQVKTARERILRKILKNRADPS